MTHLCVHRFIRFAVLCLLAVQAGCDFSPQEERILRRAFEALHQGSWSDFQQLYRNRYLIVSRQTSPNSFAASQSFSGSVLAPEEEERMKQKFARAATGGCAACIDFKTEHFKAIRDLGGVRDDILAEFGSNPDAQLQKYEVITREASSSSAKRYPSFLMTRGPTPKIVDILLPDA